MYRLNEMIPVSLSDIEQLSPSHLGDLTVLRRQKPVSTGCGQPFRGEIPDPGVSGHQAIGQAFGAQVGEGVK